MSFDVDRLFGYQQQQLKNERIPPNSSKETRGGDAAEGSCAPADTLLKEKAVNGAQTPAEGNF